MESSTGAATEKDGIRVTARKPATTPPASKRLRNVDTKMCAANDDIGVFSTSQGTRVQNLFTNGQHLTKYLALIPKSRESLPPCPAESRPSSPFRFPFQWCYSDAAGGDAQLGRRPQGGAQCRATGRNGFAAATARLDPWERLRRGLPLVWRSNKGAVCCGA